MKMKRNLVIGFVLGLALLIGLVVGASAGYQTLHNGNFGLGTDYWTVTNGTVTAYTSWGSCYPSEGPKFIRLNNNSALEQTVTGIENNSFVVLKVWGVHVDSNAAEKVMADIVWLNSSGQGIELDSVQVNMGTGACAKAYNSYGFTPPSGAVKAKVRMVNTSGKYEWFDKVQISYVPPPA